MKSFSQAQQRPFIIPTKITEGLRVNQTLTGASLYEAFGTSDVERLNAVEATLFSSTDRYNGKMLTGMTEAKGNKILINATGFKFELIGAAQQEAVVTKRINTDKIVGANQTKFDVVFDKPYFSISEIIVPGDENYRCIVEANDAAKPYRMIGANAYQYTLKLIKGDSLPSHFLDKDQKWISVSNAVADESNVHGIGFRFYSVFETQGVVQQHSVKYELTDKAAKKLHIAGLKGKVGELSSGERSYLQAMWVHNKDLNNGNMKSMTPNLSKPTSMSFVSIAEGALYNTLYRSVENTLRYGQESSHLTSTEGHTIYTSSGLNEWLDSGHVLRFGNKLDLEELESFLDNILRNKFTETPKVVLAAGLEFRRMFDEMIKDRTSGFLTLDTTFIRKNGTDYRHLDYGSYFASYKGFAIDITIVADQSLDDVYINRRKAHDKPGTPLSSWRADILDFSSPETSGTVGSDNIAMISQDYMDYNITVNGKYRGTAGATALPITDGGVGNLGVVSGFSRLIERSAGLMIKDVTRCGTIYRYQDDTDSPFTETVTGQAWFDFTN